MIDPKLLDLSALPSLPLSDRKQFPAIPCIYFAMSSGRVQYVGRSENLKARWYGHHKLKELSKDSNIAWLEVSNYELLPAIEAALIQWFEPPLNRGFAFSECSSANKVTMKVVKTIGVEVSGLGERIKKARTSDSRSLTQLAALANMTTANWYRIEGEKFNTLPYETLQNIEKALGIDLNVHFAS